MVAQVGAQEAFWGSMPTRGNVCGLLDLSMDSFNSPRRRKNAAAILIAIGGTLTVASGWDAAPRAPLAPYGYVGVAIALLGAGLLGWIFIASRLRERRRAASHSDGTGSAG
ncbi:hypothetical protein BH09PSE6_BH09PSE6_00260 [soil metagenome]